VATLVIDVGGSHVKILATGQKTERRMDSGPGLTAAQMVVGVKALAKGWNYDRVAIGYPGVVARDKPVYEPHNLGKGWVGFDYEKAFGVPVRIVNDAAMQALGGYRGGRMLYLGTGTGLGSAMIFDGVVVPLELAHLPYRNGRTYEQYAGLAGLERRGKRRWRKSVLDIIDRLQAAFICDYVLLGGGNSKYMKDLPAHVILGSNANAVEGGIRLWQDPAELKALLNPTKDPVAGSLQPRP
jgi:polyphosphate glucokinase